MVDKEQLNANSDYSDLALVVGKKKYHVHKFILESCSDVFQAMFSPSSIWAEAFSKEAKLVEEEICENVFPVFLAFMYTGKVEIKYDTALPLIILADKYNIKKLFSICSKYMTQHMVLARRKNTLLDWYHFFQFNKHQNLAEKLHKFIRHNFSKFAQTEDFYQLEFEELFNFLNCSDMRVVDETEILHIADRWLGNFSREYGQRCDDFLASLATTVRFPLMSPSDILFLNTKTDLSRQFSKLLFQYFNIVNFNEYSEISAIMLEPRFYVHDKYGVLRRFPLFTVGGNYSEETIATCADDLLSDKTQHCTVKLIFDNRIANRMDITVNLLNGPQVGYNFVLAMLLYAKQDGDLYVHQCEKYKLGPCMGYKVIKDVGGLCNILPDIQTKFLCGKNKDQLLIRLAIAKSPRHFKFVR